MFAPLAEPLKKADGLIYGSERQRMFLADNLRAVQVYVAMKPECKDFDCVKSSSENLMKVGALDFLTELLSSRSSRLIPELNSLATRLDGREFGYFVDRPQAGGNRSDHVGLVRYIKYSSRRRSPMQQSSNGFLQKKVTIGRFSNARLVRSPYGTARRWTLVLQWVL